MQMVEELKRKCDEGKIGEKECVEIRARWSEIAALLSKIAPPEPLTKRELIIRGVFVFVVFFFLSAGTGFYIKFTYFPHPTVTHTSIEGEGDTYRFIPENTVKLWDFRHFFEVSRSNSYDLSRQEKSTGTVVGWVEQPESLELYTISADEAGHSLFRYTFSKDLLSRSMATPVFSPGNLIDAQVIHEQDRFVVFYSIEIEGVPSLFVQTVSASWVPLGEPVPIATLAEAPRELTHGFSVVKNEIGYYLLTANIRDPLAPVTEKSLPVLRFLNKSFAVEKFSILATKNISVDSHLALQQLPNGGFHIFTNGRDLVAQTSELKKGDELYGLTYGADWDLLKITKLTNNGRPHDFWISDIAVHSSGMLLIPYQQIQSLPQVEGDESGYPTDAGKVFVMALRDLEWVFGTIFAADYPIRPSQSERLEGGQNAHILLSGNRVYVAHQVVIEDDPVDETDGDYGLIRVQWFDAVFP